MHVDTYRKNWSSDLVLYTFPRLYIAALHFNENSCRDQAKNRHGEPIFAVSYPKGRHGSGVPKEVKVKQTYSE